MKTKLLAILLSLMTLPAFAGLSGGVDYSSDYIWRGVSQTNGGAAVSGHLEVEKNGLYGGVWASQVDFGGDDSIEYDFYGGVALAVSNSIALDLGVIQYNYDGSSDSYEELYILANVGHFGVSYYVDMDDSDKDFVAVDMDLGFIKALDVNLEYGRHYDDTDYKQLTISKDWMGAKVGLQVLDGARHGTFMDHAALTIGWSF
tara:strand:- start:3128 stop:3733 length:606 start_codon:yes stop_codon:yes gene_type:complete